MKYTALILLFLLNFSPSDGQTRVKMTRGPGGSYSIPCTVNGKTSDFYFDTGAEVVQISGNYVEDALKSGSIKSTDILPGFQRITIADGSSFPVKQINLREIKIGNLILYNVVCVVGAGDAPMLLGQEILQRFGEYTIDNKNSTLTIQGNYKSDLDLALAMSKKKWGNKNPHIQQQLDQTKIDILRDRKIAGSLQFDVAGIDIKKNEEGEIVFKYDITNTSGLDYKTKAFSQIHIFISVYTKEGKVYSSTANVPAMPAGLTINGQNLSVKIRNNTPTTYRIYGDVNGPLLSTLED